MISVEMQYHPFDCWIHCMDKLVEGQLAPAPGTKPPRPPFCYFRTEPSFRTEPGGDFYWKLTLTSIPDPIWPTRRGLNPKRSSRLRKWGVKPTLLSLPLLPFPHPPPVTAERPKSGVCQIPLPSPSCPSPPSLYPFPSLPLPLPLPPFTPSPPPSPFPSLPFPLPPFPSLSVGGLA